MKESFLPHLIELRNRLMIIVASVIVGMALGYGYAVDIYQFLVTPLAEAYSSTGTEPRRMIFTGLTEGFFTYLKIAFYTGIALAFPIIGWQLYSFIAPGLYRHEKKFFIPFLLLAPALFISGAALAYYGVFPLAWKFFIGFEQEALQTAHGTLPGIQLEARISEYLQLCLQLMLAFGLAFQMPIVLMLLARVGLVTPASLKKFRRYAIVAIFAAAALFTPPDLISQIALAIPLLCLYECAIWLCRFVSPRTDPDATVSDTEIAEVMNEQLPP